MFSEGNLIGVVRVRFVAINSFRAIGISLGSRDRLRVVRVLAHAILLLLPPVLGMAGLREAGEGFAVLLTCCAAWVACDG